MLSNYIKLPIRRLYREKLYVLINLVGMSFAIACSLILSLYLRSELTYDQHHENHKRIYRIAVEFTNAAKTSVFAVTPTELAPMLASEFNEIESYVRFMESSSKIIRYQNDTAEWDQVYYADENVFEVFTHQIIYGDPYTALKDGSSIAVSETFAKRYFGDTNPIGEIIHTQQGDPLTITLVFEDLPDNTHLKYDVLYSYKHPNMRPSESLAVKRQKLWRVGIYSYLVMSKDFDPTDFQRISSIFYDRHMSNVGREVNASARFWLEPLADIHLHSYLQGNQPNVSKATLYAFASVALFIILVACINYINLATARALRRTKEIGMHKILGASKGSLIAQLLVETILFAIFSLLIGVAIAEVMLSLPLVNELFGKQLTLNLADEPKIALWLLGLGLVLGLLSGVYPAFYLSSWAPLSALVDTRSRGKLNTRLRQALVVIQFSISVTVIACTILMWEQMRYFSNKSLGFDKENRMVIRMVGADLLEKVPILKAELQQHPAVLGVTTHQQEWGWSRINVFPIENRDGEMSAIQVSNGRIGQNFLNVMNIKLVAGRDFSQRLLTDIGTNAIVNQAMVRKMGWDEPLGKRISDGKVIGVFEDFNYDSLHHLIEPLVLFLYEDNFNDMDERIRPLIQRFMTIKIAPGNHSETLSYLEELFAKFDPTHPFEYQFLDGTLNAQYETEQRVMTLIGFFAVICILIASLGLFGLATYTTEQRSKEISIRQVLGASTWQIILMLSLNILWLVLFGALIGSVIAYLVVDQWLSMYAYRIDIGPFAFALATAMALMVAYITIALQSFKATQTDPVQVLRQE